MATKNKIKAKNPAAVTLGRLGGTATMAKLSPEERAAGARRAAVARWAQVRAAAGKGD